MGSPQKVDLRLRATLPEIERALGEIAAACEASGAEGESCYAVRLAAEEVCLNIMKHGYNGEPGPIEIEFSSDLQSIILRITDQAPPFSPGDAPAPPDLDEQWRNLKLGGFGWHLVRNMMDSVEHEVTAAGGNRVTLTKRTPAPSPA